VPEQLLADRVALVTGAAHPEGIGRAICAALAEAGATVVGVDLAGAEGLAEIGGLACDVTDMDQVNTLVDKVLTNHGAIDVLVNNAGVGVGSADFLQITDEDWDLSLAVNLKGVANLCRAVIPNMLGRGGSIINVASLAGTGAMQSIPACYTASKFAAVGLTKVVTQMHQQSLALLAETNGISIEEAQALEDSHIPLGRSAQPREVGQAAVFLASDMGSYVTGVALPVAGGMAPGL
jgi:NAD(P)-dependent dehydrogenase (short-subunit alcohol dehydrogenase family)